MPPETVVIAADHAGFALKGAVKAHLGARGLDVLDLGTSGNRYVALAAPGTLPRDPLGPDWLRTFVEELPAETYEAEQAFAQRGGDPEAPPPAGARTAIALQIEEPTERELLQVLLWSMGHAPADVYAAPTAAGPPVALVTDAPPADPQRRHHEERGVAVFDYGMWRREHAVAGALDSHRLRTRLAGMLSVPVG